MRQARIPSADAALVTLVDLTDLGAPVVARILTAAGGYPARAPLRAMYRDRPRHPVLIGREHWSSAAEAAGGERGARDYFLGRANKVVECGDLASGPDLDTPADLATAASGTTSPERR